MAPTSSSTGLAIAQQGDTVDLVAWREYRDTAMTEPLLEANPGLAALGPVLPQGTSIRLPARETPPPAPQYTLW
jgi:phage tail protein X